MENLSFEIGSFGDSVTKIGVNFFLNMAHCAFWASSDAVGRKFIFHSEPKDSKGG